MKERRFSRRPFIDAFVAIALFLVAAVVRLAPWNSVYRAEGVVPFDPDAFYHLRRIQFSVENFPQALTFDPFLNFPNGAAPIWPPTFDWLLAGLFRALLGADRPEVVERLAMLVPPFLGALTVVLLYFIGRRYYERITAGVAAVILAFLPAHFYYSELGFLDHHVLVALLTLLMLAATMELLRAPSVPSPSESALRAPQSVALGLAMATGILVWPGCLIHVGIIQIGLVAACVGAVETSAAIDRSRRFALVHIVACLVVLPFSAGNEWPRWGAFSPLVLSNFQPVYFGVAALYFGLLGELWRRGRSASSRTQRGVLSGALAATLLCASVAAIPELLSVSFDAWSWLAKEEAFQAVVRESKPLFSGPGGGRGQAVQYFTAFIYAVPVALCFCGSLLRQRVEQLFLFWWAFALFAATLNQWRFMNSFVTSYALLIPLTFQLGFEHLAPKFARSRIPMKFWRIAAFAGMAWIAFPAVQFYQPFALHAQQVLSGNVPQLGENSRRRMLAMTTARWLRDNSPSIDPPEYSVLGPWDVGHVLKYVAQRPVVQDNFGDDVGIENFEFAEAYFAAKSERSGLDILENTATRYVIVSAAGSGHSRGYDYDSLHTQLFYLRGTRGRWKARDHDRDVVLPALERHRLIYESAPLRPHRPDARPLHRVYEVVAGAELVGVADPGAAVQAQLSVRSRHGGKFTYTAVTRADVSGRYVLRLPYSNDPFSPDVGVGEHYSLTSGAAASVVAISEDVVREGKRVAGPSLRSARAGPRG